MLVSEIKEIKEKYGFTCQMISDASNVPMSTVLKIFSGSIKNPRNTTIDKLSNGIRSLQLDYISREMNDRKSFAVYDSGIDAGEVEEAASFGSDFGAKKLSDDEINSSYRSLKELQIISSKKPGEFTIDDLKDMPDGVRYEIFDGRLVRMESPSTLHQTIASEIYFQIRLFIQKNRGKCIPYLAPLDVQFDDVGKNVLEPDVFVICKGKPVYKRVYNVPDFIIEIISPTNRKYDMQDKLSKYTEYGVREYWIVDPFKRSIIVHDIENCGIAIYTFEDKVPVNIYDGKLKIDFKAIDYIDDMYDEEGNVIT